MQYLFDHARGRRTHYCGRWLEPGRTYELTKGDVQILEAQGFDLEPVEGPPADKGAEGQTPDTQVVEVDGTVEVVEVEGPPADKAAEVLASWEWPDQLKYANQFFPDGEKLRTKKDVHDYLQAFAVPIGDDE